jgi:hypothetical protein
MKKLFTVILSALLPLVALGQGAFVRSLDGFATNLTIRGGTLIRVNASGATNMNASNLTSGTVPEARSQHNLTNVTLLTPTSTNLVQRLINPSDNTGMVGARLGSGLLWQSTAGANLFGFSPTGFNIYTKAVFHDMISASDGSILLGGTGVVASAFYGDGSHLTGLTNLSAGTSNTVLLVRSDGSRESYVTSADNAVARGNALLAALAAQNTNNLILIGPGVFDLLFNSVITSNGVRLAGSGEFSTILTNTVILYNQSNSFSDLTVIDRSGGPFTQQFHASASTYAGPYLDHVYAVGNVDCFVMSKPSVDFSADNCIFLGVQGDSVTGKGSGRFNNCVFGGATSAYRETSTNAYFTFKSCSFTNYATTASGVVVTLEGWGDIFENCDFNGVSASTNSIGVDVQCGAAPWLLNCRITTSSSADTPNDIVVDAAGFCYVNAATVYQEAKTTGTITPLTGNGAGLFGIRGGAGGTTRFYHGQNATNSSGVLMDDISGGSPGGANMQVQFNNSGVFAGNAGLTYDSTNSILILNGASSRITLSATNTEHSRIDFLGDDGDEMGALLCIGTNFVTASRRGWLDFVNLKGGFEVWTHNSADVAPRFKVFPSGGVTIGDLSDPGTGVVVANAGMTSYRSNGIAPTSITFPASTVNWTNPLNCSIQIYIDNFGVTGSVFKKNGGQISSGITQFMQVGLQAGEYFSENYTIGTPTATYSPFP